MSEPHPLPDEEARRRIREDLGATLFVEAAAGTGKTSALVSRIVALLAAGRTELERIVAVTFTEKAAGEMKLRVRAAIEDALADPGSGSEVLGRLRRALGQLELARITTIHAFCGDLLRERPVEAGVDPLFEVAPEDEKERILEAVFARWFEGVLDAPPEGVRRVLHRRPRGFDAAGPREQLRGALGALVEHRDFRAPWRREAFDRDGALDALLGELEEVAALAGRAADRESDWLALNLAELARFVDENRLREGVRGRDHDALEADLRELARSRQIHWHWRGSPRRPFGPGLDRGDVIARRDALKRELDRLLERADADLAACLQRELAPVAFAFEDAKRRAGRLDFLDLLLQARDLVRGNREVRAHYQARFSHFFVDEFQDTDPLQAELLLLLAARDADCDDWRRAVPVPGKLFLVGDPKQSIYRFRRADLAVYLDVKSRLAAWDAELLELTTSFRAVPSIQALVNEAFAPVLTGQEGVLDYVPLEPSRPEPPERPTPSVVALPAPQVLSDWGRVVGWRIDESFPDAVGAFVDWLIRESGWTVSERDRERGAGAWLEVPLQARHVCLLFRRFRRFRDDVTRPYVRALEARHVPHVLVGGRSFHEREEVLAIRNALSAIEWPEDELRVFATLRGPLFALGDDALLAYRHRRGPAGLHPLRPLPEEQREKLDAHERAVADALAVVAELHRLRNRRPVAETLARLLETVRAHAGLAIWPTGEQALANVLRTIDVARRFERGGARSFRAFALHMEDEAERGDAQDAPVVEEGTEGVRIMTVHRAKGLEFPVVVLCDPTCNAIRAVPTRHVDAGRELWAEPLCGCTPWDLHDARAAELRRDAEEAVRLAYVAATRARDLLVLPVALDPRAEASPPEPVAESWLGALHGAAYDPGRRFDLDPLVLDVHEEVGLRQQRILESDEDEAASAARASLEAHAAWQRRRAETREAASAPSSPVEAVTELAERLAEAGEEAALPVAIEEVGEVAAGRGERPGGVRFGTLVHAVLAAVPLEADEAGVERVAALQGRLLGAAADEIAAARVSALAALAHPLLRRAAASADVRRETPVLLRLPGGSLVEGVVDLAFAEDGGWTVVDFKTDRELAARRAVYEIQVGLYARAVAEATGREARAVLLVV